MINAPVGPHTASNCARVVGGPAAFLSNFREAVRIKGIEIVRGPLGRVAQKTDGVETHHQFLRAVTGAAASLSVEIDQRAKASRLSTDDGDRQRETELACADERGWRATHTDPYRQGFAAGEDRPPGR
jgi:hypothetical protein